MLKKIFEYLLHASTWKGLIAVATAAGVAISPELADKIIAAGMACVGAIQIFIDDRKKDALKDKSGNKE